MKVRSKDLWNYLLQSGALESQDEAIIQNAKRIYRKMYKRDWERKNRNIRELRIRFSFKQMNEIARHSKLFNLNCTSYAKEVILTSQENRIMIPCREELLGILKDVGMAINILSEKPDAKVQTLLYKAEIQLIDYLNLGSDDHQIIAPAQPGLQVPSEIHPERK